MLIAITVGHTGRPSKDFKDMGAVLPSGTTEVEVVRDYVAALERALRAKGFQVVVLSDGSYQDQWKRADEYGAAVYLNCHMNAGGGNRGELFYDHRSSKGKVLASLIAKAITGQIATFPWPTVVKPCQSDTNGAPRDSDYSEAFGCISGVKAVALVVEAYFLDGPHLSDFWGRTDKWAELFAVGVAAWAKADGKTPTA